MPAVRWPLLTLTLLLLVAGCLEGLGPQVSCTTLDERSPSHNAPLAATLQRPPGGLARHLAQAVGDRVQEGPWTGRTVVGDQPALRWNTTNGTVTYLPANGTGFQLIRYWGYEHFTPLDGSSAGADLAQVLQRIGIEPRAIGEVDVRASPGRLDGEARQRWSGQALHWAHGEASPGVWFWENEDSEAVDDYRMQISLSGLFDLSEARVELDRDEARSVAGRALDCRHGIDGEAHGPSPSMGVAQGSLAYLVGVGYQVEEGCHGERVRTVWVDAVTGAALRVGPEGAGCVT